ncbi:MAG: sodium:proton antiporter [bacterium]|nr:sodium:proton antiporter [bacterium]
MSSHSAMNAHSGPPEQGRSRLNAMAWYSIAGSVLIAAILVYHVLSHHEPSHGHHELPALWGIGILPFVGILACIAFLPLIRWTEHWWESNVNRLGVALSFALLTLVYYLIVRGPSSLGLVLDHAILKDYIPFIVLLFCLYVISGGIALRGDLAAHPITNTGFIAVGAILASFIGTTGASMLLIRPLLQTNSERKHVMHTVIFFIFLVSNIGGTLLPVGDPPLFLGYLRGVEFFWTLGLWKPWATCCVILLVIYYLWDTYLYKKERPEDIQLDETQKEPLQLTGGINLLYLAGIVAAVAFIVPGKTFPLLGFEVFPFLREMVMLALVAISLKTTPPGAREFNQFNYAAILEVAALFVGIFIAMQVPIEVLNSKGSALGLTQAWHFFWATGSLSSFLDNAPTYVVFFETANAMTTEAGPEVMTLTTGDFIRENLLIGISLGAVFMGAMTYIGNGPNFMVRAIAEQSGIKMPSFLGYLFKYSIPILIPVFAVIVWIFLV